MFDDSMQFLIKTTSLLWKNKMPLKTKQPEQFIVLIAGDIDINDESLKHLHRNIIVTAKHDDILMRIETTQFHLILLDWSLNHSEIIPHIKYPLGLNSKTPVIAIINPVSGSRNDQQLSPAFDDSLMAPLTAHQLDEVIDIWQTKALAQDYIQIILTKTKNNQRLTLTLFETLFEELPLQAINIRNALANAQYDLAQEVTHKLNGSVSFCGLIDIQQSANALESCLLNNNYATAHQHFLILQQCILNFTRHQKFILASLKS